MRGYAPLGLNGVSMGSQWGGNRLALSSSEDTRTPLDPHHHRRGYLGHELSEKFGRWFCEAPLAFALSGWRPTKTQDPRLTSGSPNQLVDATSFRLIVEVRLTSHVRRNILVTDQLIDIVLCRVDELNIDVRPDC